MKNLRLYLFFFNLYILSFKPIVTKVSPFNMLYLPDNLLKIRLSNNIITTLINGATINQNKLTDSGKMTQEFALYLTNSLSYYPKKIVESLINNIGVGFSYDQLLKKPERGFTEDFFNRSVFWNLNASMAFFSLYQTDHNPIFNIDDNKTSIYDQMLGFFIGINQFNTNKIKPSFLEKLLFNLFIKIGLCLKIGSFVYNINANRNKDFVKFFPLHYLKLLAPGAIGKSSTSNKKTYFYHFKVFFAVCCDYKIFNFKSMDVTLSFKWMDNKISCGFQMVYVVKRSENIKTFAIYKSLNDDREEKEKSKAIESKNTYGDYIT